MGDGSSPHTLYVEYAIRVRYVPCVLSHPGFFVIFLGHAEVIRVGVDGMDLEDIERDIHRCKGRGVRSSHNYIAVSLTSSVVGTH